MKRFLISILLCFLIAAANAQATMSKFKADPILEAPMLRVINEKMADLKLRTRYVDKDLFENSSRATFESLMPKIIASNYRLNLDQEELLKTNPGKGNFTRFTYYAYYEMISPQFLTQDEVLDITPAVGVRVLGQRSQLPFWWEDVKSFGMFSRSQIIKTHPNGSVEAVYFFDMIVELKPEKHSTMNPFTYRWGKYSNDYLDIKQKSSDHPLFDRRESYVYYSCQDKL